MTSGGAGGRGGGTDAVGHWLGVGEAAREALAETWGSLADACHELSSTEWALPTECPGWDVKDQLSHLIGIERSIMGEAAPVWDSPLGPHVKNDFAVVNEPWVASVALAAALRCTPNSSR